MRRPVYMVLSPSSLPYARLALRSLLANSRDALALTLITDSAGDQQQLQDALQDIGLGAQHRTRVLAKDDLADAEAERFAHLTNLRRFRHGHPCWRKITDPLLAGTAGEEMVLLDPDLYFPNRFRFAATPAAGVLLMWQQPNCLLPAQVVRAAMEADIPLARHVDIGVAQWRTRADLTELEYLDWLIAKLGGASLPRAMHVEAIVWAALAMRLGGGHLDPNQWVCWRRSQLKRVQRKLGVSGAAILRNEPWKQMKCFHAGGEAKWWLSKMPLPELSTGNAMGDERSILPFVPLTPARYGNEQVIKRVAARLGYYRVFGAA